MKLRYCTDLSFAKTEVNLYEEAKKKYRRDYKSDMKLGPEDVVCVTSLSGNQVLFLHGFRGVEDARGETRRAFRSSRVRLTDGHWNARMLQNYANSVGIHIDGFKRFEDHMEQYLEDKRKHRRNLEHKRDGGSSAVANKVLRRIS